MTDAITITRDDGSPLTLSRVEAVRAMAAYQHAVLLDAVRGGVRVGSCGGASRCDACRRAREVRR